MCDKCLCKPVCSRYEATGGVNKCGYFRADRRGKWTLVPHAFYRDTFDENCEFVIYITAECSECGCRHPNNYQVFSKYLFAPDDADDDFRFDEEKEKAIALDEFYTMKKQFATHCPDCGAFMTQE